MLGGRTFATRDQATGEWMDNGQHVLLGCYHDTLAFTRRVGAGRLARCRARCASRWWTGRRRQRAAQPGAAGAAAPARRGARLVGALLARSSVGALAWPRALGDQRGAAGRPDACAVAGRARPGAAVVRSAVGAAGGGGAQPEHRHRRGDDVRRSGAANARPRARRRRAGVAGPVADPYLRRAGRGISSSAAAARSTPAPPRVVVFDARPRHRRRGEGRAGRGPRGDRRRALARAGRSAAGTGAGPLHDAIAAASAMRSSPIVTANLWFDRPVLTQPFVGLPGRSFQWAFDRAQVTAGESTASRWCAAAPTPSCSSRTRRSSHGALRASPGAPGGAAASFRRGTAVRERRATFSLAR